VQARVDFDRSQHDGFSGQVSLPICIACDANDTAAAWTGANSKPSAISTPINMRQVCHGSVNVMLSR
jgi:hypothetical protein